MKLPGLTPDLSSGYDQGTPEWWVEKWTKLEGVVVSNRRMTILLLAGAVAAILGDVGGARELVRELVAALVGG